VANKLGTSVALLGTGFVLNITGFDVARGALQHPGVLSEMRAINAILPALGIGIAFLCLYQIKNKTRILPATAAPMRVESALRSSE
jgi:Na+/melibiose symporter-like transporter